MKEIKLSSSKDLDALMERIGDARVVLLGEATHGTHEFYTWRTAISKRLIEEKKFNFIAVEGDWPDCYRVNRFVKGLSDQEKAPQDVLRCFNRWPSWMWANWEIAALISWLKDHNLRNKKAKAGFYGLDVYSLWESMEALIAYLKKEDPAAANIASEALDCLSGFGNDEKDYAAKSMSEPCRDQVVRLLKEIRMKAPAYDHDPEAELNAVQNASVAVEAEKYYRNMVSFNNQTWNIRDSHMMSSLERLLEFHGPAAKAVVWEHNTHVGDARYTDMAASGMHNLGQLCRQRFPGGETVIVGFGSYSGSVIAGSEWGANMREMEVPPASKGSVEESLHSQYGDNRLLVFDQTTQHGDEDFNHVMPHRAIGVVYNPGAEKRNYVPTLLTKRYDAFVYVDRSKALHPLALNPDLKQVPETFPFNF